ncbi:MAG: aminotransferase class V-fold PLP-dependent enzyme [Gemmataceae bacterium]
MPTIDQQIKWNSARAQMMLDPDIVNLNSGSFGPTPRPVFEAATRYRERLAAEPVAFLIRETPDMLWDAREQLARFVGGMPERLIFTTNVSASMNIVANALQLSCPGEILLTDHEYGAMHWCWERCAQRLGLRLRTFPLPVMTESPDEIVEAVVSAIRPETRLLFLSHVVSHTGLVLPVEKICHAARGRGVLTVIDGAHAPVMVRVNVEQIGCDFYGANCHKWLLAPIGAGFLYASGENMRRLRPLHVSWGWHYPHAKADEKSPFGNTHRIHHLEFEGTRDPSPWLAVRDALAFQDSLGWANIRTRNEQLVQHVRLRLGEEIGLLHWTPNHPELHGFLTAFRLSEGLSPEILRQLFWERKIEVLIAERPYGPALRVSTHFYNTHEEIDHLASVLPEVLEEARRLSSQPKQRDDSYPL